MLMNRNLLITLGVLAAFAVIAIPNKSKDYLNLTDAEKRDIDYLMGNFKYTYQEALDIVLTKRLEYKGSSGWAD
jgi:hypothetical protein